ncbi:restriction endonuclease subunit S [Xanthomonas campestris]|uniref:restriction endonuclease subunit S n=1 Tax=Xanthomonas campestris TaxID=339 RepID=UPI0023685319|nr:restriction endonuclease subunit S [Xanthomonas campestris]WDJ00942.1 restriction endonuclease subunit S [Xanthomonas campestris]
MTALLTDNLPLLTGAPNGIKKLRELILELAVRGKLVPQDANDEPASELLKRIAEEKARLVAEGKIKKQKPLAEIGEEETPFEVPTNWAWTRLGELGLVGSSSRVHQKDWQTSGIPFYRAREIVRLSKDGFVENELFISEALYQELSTGESAPKVGDIMLTGVGTIGVPYRVQKTDRFYFKDASVLIFKNHIADNSDYLLKYFVSPLWIEKIHAESMGTTVHTLTIGRANETLCPLPPLAEQHRIVAKVDELMALCDRLEARQADAGSAHAQPVQALLESLTQARDAEDFAQSWQRLAEHFYTLFTTEPSIDALKQTLLQLAVMGKLVPQDPGDEHAGELLRKIRLERQAANLGVNKIDKRPYVEANDEFPFKLPSQWVWSRLGKLAISGPSNGNSPRPASVETLYRCLTLSATTRGEFNGQCFKFVDIDADTARKYFLKNGDLLIQRANSIDYVGVSAIYDGADNQFIFPDLMMRLRMSDCVSRSFVHAYLSSMTGRLYFRSHATGTQGNMPKINQGTVVNAPIPIPPLAEQHRIVAKLDQLMALCDQLKSRLSKARQVHEHLANALIGQALNGEKKSGAEVVDFSAYLISKLASQRTFGRVAHMKLLFLADSHLGLGLMDGYRRHAAGPLDTTIYRVEQRAAQEGLYSTSIEVLKSGQEKVSYHIGANISRSVETAASALGAAQKELDRLIALFEGRKTEDLEAVATLYAVWNDALAGGLHPNDEWLINEFRSNWHEAKERFTPDILGNWLGWMRDNGLVPTGNSATTKSQAAFLFD